MRILVTGATGNVGREVVRALGARGDVVVRAAASDVARVRDEHPPPVEAARVDFTDARTWAEAVAGCDALFLLRPPAVADTKRTLVPFIDAARAAGVGQVVFLSVAGADRMRWVPHVAVEEHLRARRGAWTILRPGFFAQNLADAYRRDIVEEGRIYVPAGRGRVAWVDARDLGEAAARVLVDAAPHRQNAYTLTGPEAVDFEAVARLLSAALGRALFYEPASALGYVLHLRRRRLPLGQIAVQLVLHLGLRNGDAEAVDPTLERLLGRRPRTVGEYVRDHRALFAR